LKELENSMRNSGQTIALKVRINYTKLEVVFNFTPEYYKILEFLNLVYSFKRFEILKGF